VTVADIGPGGTRKIAISFFVDGPRAGQFTADMGSDPPDEWCVPVVYDFVASEPVEPGDYRIMRHVETYHRFRRFTVTADLGDRYALPPIVVTLYTVDRDLAEQTRSVADLPYRYGVERIARDVQLWLVGELSRRFGSSLPLARNLLGT
jgi:hypothetical protein